MQESTVSNYSPVCSALVRAFQEALLHMLWAGPLLLPDNLCIASPAQVAKQRLPCALVSLANKVY